MSTVPRSSSRPRRSAARKPAATTPIRRRSAPKGFITGAEYKWETIYKGYAADIKAGKTPPNFIAGGYEVDFVRNSPFGAGCTPEGQKAAMAAIEGLKKGKEIYVGPLKDNKGKVVIDKTYGNLDPFLDKMDYLLDGVVGSTT